MPVSQVTIKTKLSACDDVAAYLTTMKMPKVLFRLPQQSIIRDMGGDGKYELSNCLATLTPRCTSQRTSEIYSPLPSLHSLTTKALLNQTTKDTQQSSEPPQRELSPQLLMQASQCVHRPTNSDFIHAFKPIVQNLRMP